MRTLLVISLLSYLTRTLADVSYAGYTVLEVVPKTNEQVKTVVMWTGTETIQFFVENMSII